MAIITDNNQRKNAKAFVIFSDTASTEVTYDRRRLTKLRSQQREVIEKQFGGSTYFITVQRSLNHDGSVSESVGWETAEQRDARHAETKAEQAGFLFYHAEHDLFDNIERLALDLEEAAKRIRREALRCQTSQSYAQRYGVAYTIQSELHTALANIHAYRLLRDEQEMNRSLERMHEAGAACKLTDAKSLG